MFTGKSKLVSQFNEEQALRTLIELYRKYFQTRKTVPQAMNDAVRLGHTELTYLVRITEPEIESIINEELLFITDMVDWLRLKKAQDDELTQRLQHLSLRQTNPKMSRDLNEAFLKCADDTATLENIINKHKLAIAEYKADLLKLRHIRATFIEDEEPESEIAHWILGND